MIQIITPEELGEIVTSAKPDGSGIGPNVVHPHHAPLRRIAASDGNTGSRAASRPYSEKYPCKTAGKAVKKAS